MEPLDDGDDDANTPLTDEGLHGLIPSWVTTRGDLNEVEAANVAKGYEQTLTHLPAIEVIASDTFVRDLHKRLFGDVWRWAGTYRSHETNIGQRWIHIPASVRQATENFRFRFSGIAPSDVDKECVAFHYEIVSIHPFSNGNGRLSRALADMASLSLGGEFFRWGERSIAAAGTTRAAYVAALRAADSGDFEPLLSFARGNTVEGT